MKCGSDWPSPCGEDLFNSVGRMPEHGYTISSLCEPNGLGE